jgi:hypothetical protein
MGRERWAGWRAFRGVGFIHEIQVNGAIILWIIGVCSFRALDWGRPKMGCLVKTVLGMRGGSVLYRYPAY